MNLEIVSVAVLFPLHGKWTFFTEPYSWGAAG